MRIKIWTLEGCTDTVDIHKVNSAAAHNKMDHNDQIAQNAMGTIGMAMKCLSQRTVDATAGWKPTIPCQKDQLIEGCMCHIYQPHPGESQENVSSFMNTLPSIKVHGRFGLQKLDYQ